MLRLFIGLFILCTMSLLAHDTSVYCKNKTELTDAIFPRTDPTTIGLIYQMLKVIDILFTNHNIIYWIDGGTALGALRHQGCIPWDDDADLIYHIADESRILALAEEFSLYGFDLKKEHILRLYPSKSRRHPFIDLTGYQLCADHTYRVDLKWARLFPSFYWLPKEIDPLIRVQFGPLMLSAPNDMMRYVLTGYGADCLTHAVFQTHHGGAGSTITIREKVRIVDYSPAKYSNDNPQISLD